MHFRKFFGVFLALLLVSAVLPVSAQGGLNEDQKALLAIVASAQENFLAQNSYTFTGSQNTEQVISSGVGVRAMVITQNIDQDLTGTVVKSGDLLNSQQTVSQRVGVVLTGSAEPTNISMDLELALVDGEIYIRFTSVPEDTTFSGYPTNWVNFSEVSSLPGLDTLNPEALAAISSSAIPTYEFNEETVTAIEEVTPDESYTGPAARAIKVTLNAQNAIGDTLGTLFNLPGITPEIIDALLGATTSEITLYIGNEDNLIHRIVSDVNIDYTFEAGTLGPDPITLTQTTALTFDVAKIGDETLTVTVPTPEPTAEPTAVPTDAPAEEATAAPTAE